jgi:DNA repair protein RecN (Recombination protein N)
MLGHLRVANLGVLQEVSIEPDSGLTVITGETGAGKTLLLGGLRLLLGEKADSSAVGPFSDNGQADGLFEAGEEEVGVTRIVPARGRSRAYIDGSIVSADALSAKVGALVEIVGQHDHLSLKQGSRVLALIDGALDEEKARHLAEYRTAWNALQEVRERQADLGGNEMALRQELDLVRFQATEIEAASLEAGEDEALETEASRHENVFELRELLAESMDIGDGLSDQSGELVSRLRRLRSLDASQSHLVEQAEGVAATLSELLTDVRRNAEGVEVDPERADEVGQRLTLIGDLKRKYGATLDDVIEFGEKARARQEELDDLLEAAGRIESDLAEALAAVEETGLRLTQSRQQAARHIAGESERHLADLGLERARLIVDVTPLTEPGPRGIDQVEILFSADEHLTPGPISSVASGGELSRLVLAFRLATRAPGTQTLVFDEVDAGVGGATALSLGRKLAALAESTQVLCVTHLPQIAAFADTHYVVSREGKTASLRLVTGEERLQEISRMLAGLPESQAGQDAAAELLETAAE